MKSNAQRRRLRLALQVAIVVVVICVALNLGSCASPAYYWQAASGHLSLMRARQDIDETLSAEDADEETLRKLRLSREIKAFAVAELGLPDNDSYSEFVRTGRDAVVWNVVAAPEFSLEAREWCFPVSGCVPYRGYFDQAAAERFAARVNDRGYDVAVSPAIAYSTLGWFDDPLLDTMWRSSDTQFAAYLFHEMAHQELYVKGDARFNESYATFVEQIGVERWLAQRGDSEARERWQTLSAAGEAFNALLFEARDRLQAAYTAPGDEASMRRAKQAVLDQLRSDYRLLRDEQWAGRDYFGGWFEQPLNNARFALLESYEGGVCAFARLYAEAGNDIAAFHQGAREKSQLPPAERRQWLNTPCAVEA